MKNYLLILSFFTFFISQAQLSNKHWLPPLHARDESTIQDHYVYLSTAETTPFQITITTGNGIPIPGSPFTISQTNPVEVNIGNGQPTDMFLDVTDVNVVKSDVTSTKIVKIKPLKIFIIMQISKILSDRNL